MERIYDALELGEFSQVRPAAQRYVDGLHGYRKNQFPELPTALRRQIADACRRFDQWQYALDLATGHQRAAAHQGARLGPSVAG